MTGSVTTLNRQCQTKRKLIIEDDSDCEQSYSGKNNSRPSDTKRAKLGIDTSIKEKSDEEELYNGSDSLDILDSDDMQDMMDPFKFTALEAFNHPDAVTVPLKISNSKQQVSPV